LIWVTLDMPVRPVEKEYAEPCGGGRGELAALLTPLPDGWTEAVDTYANYSAREAAYSLPLDEIYVSDPRLYYKTHRIPISSGCAGRTRCTTRR
jgi:hypothetical protein